MTRLASCGATSTISSSRSTKRNRVASWRSSSPTAGRRRKPVPSLTGSTITWWRWRSGRTTTRYAERGWGAVPLTWKNAPQREARGARGELEGVTPPLSIRAEPHVAVVDSSVDRKGTRQAAQAYLNYTYTDEAQELIARNF